MRGDEVGLFWEEIIPTKPEKEAKAPVSREPVILKPYVPRDPIKFTPLTDDELIAGAGGYLIFDTESFSNLFLIAFKCLRTGHVLTLQTPFDQAKLYWILHNYTVVGFNSFKYDLPLVWLSYVNSNTTVLKWASTDLIKEQMWRTQLMTKYKFGMDDTDHIDLIEVCPLSGSLKLYGARLHAKRIQDLPWADQLTLEDWQIPITIDYCINDLDNTELIFNNLSEQLALRSALSEEYQQDLRSKSDAQIAETVIGNEIKKLKGKFPPRPKVSPGKVYYFVPPKNLNFKSDYMKGILDKISKAQFVIASTGYLIRPKDIEELEISLGNSIYRMGIGGLHSSEKTTALVADDNSILVDRDVESYYPKIILNCGLYPQSIGTDFAKVYKSLVDRRLAAKKAKNIAQSENLKVTVNGTFGKTGSPYSILYAPEVVIQILLGGQLYLLMIIERLEAAGIPVVSANTDGFLMRCPVAKEKEMVDIITQWEKETGFVTEETRYKAVYARDVNAYMAVKLDGSVKGKNIFYDPWRAEAGAREKYWRFQKNPTCQICVEAVEKFITRGIPLEETIYECNDVTKFVAIKNVTGGAHWDCNYLGKVVRWIYVNDSTGTINYINSNRIVADTEGAMPLMDLPDELPGNIDYDRYLKRCRDMLTDMGYPLTDSKESA